MISNVKCKKEIKNRSRNKFGILAFLISIFLSQNLFAQDTTNVSFETQNRKSKYKSFSFGMGANYGSNEELVRYIGYRLPFYNTLPDERKLSDYSTGLEFFFGAEFQVAKRFSLKADYSYQIKSFNVADYPAYEYSYISHQPYLMGYYVLPQRFSFVKFGAGAGYILSDFTQKEFGGELSYSSKGPAVKLETVFNLQISKTVAGYLGGSMFNTFMSELEDSNGNKLLNANNETVKLSSFGLGIRLGVEIFIF